MDKEYSKLEFELKKAISNCGQSKTSPKKEAEITRAIEWLQEKISKLDMSAIEKKHPKTFLFWLLDTYLGYPVEMQLSNLGMLRIIRYSFVQKNAQGDSLFSYFVRHPRARLLFQQFFENFPDYIFKSNDPAHPLLMPELNDDLFRYLVINFHKFNPPKLTPIIFAIRIKNKSLITRILQHFPWMINSPTHEGIYPIAMAIFSESFEILDFILSHLSSIEQVNVYLSRNSLAHIIFLVQNKEFTKTVIFDEKYAGLNLQSTILSQTLHNANGQLPIFCALNEGHYELFEHIVTLNPSMKDEFPHLLIQLIHVPTLHGFNYLYRQHHFSPLQTPELFSKFTTLFLSAEKFHILKWISELETLDSSYAKAFNLFSAILSKDDATMLRLLGDSSIEWSSMLPIIPWKITELLLKAKASAPS